jgi:predicted GIY-YIG superfamily endonuclease
MEQKNYKWVQRDKEWINNNPNKGTMYKVLVEDVIVTSSLGKQSRCRVIEGENLGLKYSKKLDAGIYIIVCEVEKHVYVGQSTNVPSRIRNHKMNISKDNPASDKIYYKMRKHKMIHSINAFQFSMYESLPGADNALLLQREITAMKEWFKKGYLLYNNSVLQSIKDQYVYCPFELRSLVTSVVSTLTNDAEFVNLLTVMINSRAL